MSFHFFWNANDDTFFLLSLQCARTFFLIVNTAHWVPSGLKYAVTVSFHRYDLSKSVSENSNPLVCDRPPALSNCLANCLLSQFPSVPAHTLYPLPLLPSTFHHRCHPPHTLSASNKAQKALSAVLPIPIPSIPHLIRTFERCLLCSPSSNRA